MTSTRVVERATVGGRPRNNFAVPAPLVNALDYLFHEWAHKPVGFVSYGGQSGGIRAVQMAKLILTALKMMPVPEAVAIPFFTQRFDDAGAFATDDSLTRAARAMLDELLRWTMALAPLRLMEAQAAAAAAACAPPAIAVVPAAQPEARRRPSAPPSPPARGTRH